MDRILDRSAERVLDSVVAGGGVAVQFLHIGTAITPNLWTKLPHGLSRTAGRALASAIENVRTLIASSLTDQDLRELFQKVLGTGGIVNEAGGLLAGPFAKRLVEPPLRAFLLVDERVVPEADHRLTRASLQQLTAAYNAMEHVDKEHQRRDRWILGGNVAVRVIGLGGQYPVSLAAAGAMVVGSVYLAHDFVDSPQMARLIPRLFAGIPSVLEMCIPGRVAEG